MKEKKGQILIESVIYVLISLTLIGIVLFVIKPKIDSSSEKVIIEQSINSLKNFDDKIEEMIDNGEGNVINANDFSLKKGELTINGESDEITLVLKELSKPYSELGANIKYGNVDLASKAENKRYSVYLSLNYSNNVNLTLNDLDIKKTFNPSSVPYRFSISNEGGDRTKLLVINIEQT